MKLKILLVLLLVSCDKEAILTDLSTSYDEVCLGGYLYYRTDVHGGYTFTPKIKDGTFAPCFTDKK